MLTIQYDENRSANGGVTDWWEGTYWTQREAVTKIVIDASMADMFYSAGKLKSVDLSHLDTHYVRDMSGLFFEITATKVLLFFELCKKRHFLVAFLAQIGSIFCSEKLCM